MVGPERDNFIYFQVDRPILHGAHEFLAQVEDIGRRVVRSALASSIPVQHAEVSQRGDADKMEMVTTRRRIEGSRLDVFSPHELRMILLRRVAPKEMERRYNFSHHAAEMNKRPRRKQGQQAGKSTKEIINEIGGQDTLDANHTGIHSMAITTGNDPIFGKFLALVPEAGVKASFALTQQAERGFEEYAKLSPRIAYGSSPATPLVPFASLPDDITQVEYTRLIQEAHELVPRIEMGGIDIYSGASIARQSSIQPEED